MARLTKARKDRHDPFVAGLPEPPSEDVGARLRRLRSEQGLSQRDLSSPGITYAYISRIEAGARTPSVKALRMLAAKLGVTPEYLETGSDLDAADLRELRIAEQELRLRLEGEADREALGRILADAEAARGSGRGDPRTDRARPRGGRARRSRGRRRAALEPSSDRSSSRPSRGRTSTRRSGRALAASGSAREAVALFEGALAELGAGRSPRTSRRAIRYSTYLSYALTDLGELARAKAVVAGAVRRVERSGRPVLAGAAALVARPDLARAGAAAGGARQLPSGGRRCSRRPRTRCTWRAPMWRARTR